MNTTTSSPNYRSTAPQAPRSNHRPWERSQLRLALRLSAGALVLFVGLDHYYEHHAEHYAVLPTIGTLFLLNFLGAVVCGLLLLAPLERASRDLGRAMWWLAALGGFAIATTSFIGLLVSEQTPLFGFMEVNYRPAIVVGLASEAAAAVVSGLFLVLDARHVDQAQRRFAQARVAARIEDTPTGDGTREEPRRDPSSGRRA